MSEITNSNFIINNFDDEEQENASQNSTPKRKKSEYRVVQHFRTEVELRDWMKNEAEDCWTKANTNNSNKALYFTEYFYCKFYRRKANECSALLKVRRNKETGEIFVFQSQEHAEHYPLQGITAAAKSCILPRIEMKQTAARIRDSILLEQNAAPTMRQVQNFVAYEKKKNGKNDPMTIEELREYCIANSNEPEDQNEPFIIGHQIESQQGICIVWSTKRLIQLQQSAKHIMVDGTYKIMTLNWPILRCGFSDGRNRFHATAIALANSEDEKCYLNFFEFVARSQTGQKWHPIYLMADAAPAISAAQRTCWPNCARANCYFHLTKTVKEHLRKKPLADHCEEVLADIRTLQKAGTYAEFIKSARVLNAHWLNVWRNDNAMRQVLGTFVDFYIRSDQNCGWFAGFAPECPTTNNGMESSNRQFKDRDTLRRRLPIREFLDVVMQNIKVASLSPEHQNPIRLPPISNELYKAAYELERERRTMVQLQDEERTVLIPSKKGLTEFSGDNALLMVQVYEHMHSENEDNNYFQSWDEYKEIRSKFHFIRCSQIWPDYYYCSCWQAGKRKPCKHSVLVMKLRGIIEYPAIVTAEQLQAARKRGRPKNVRAGQALMKN